MDNPACQECQNIAEEIAKAYGDAWASSDRNLKEAWIAAYKMIGGTEEDAARAEEILDKYRPALLWQLEFAGYGFTDGSARIREAIVRKFKHQVLTGHKIRAWPYPSF